MVKLDGKVSPSGPASPRTVRTQQSRRRNNRLSRLVAYKQNPEVAKAENEVYSTNPRFIENVESCHSALRSCLVLDKLHQEAAGGNVCILRGMGEELEEQFQAVDYLSQRCSMWTIFKRTIGSEYMSSMIAQRCMKIKEMQINLETEQLMLLKIEIQAQIRHLSKVTDTAADSHMLGFARVVNKSRDRYELRSAELSGDIGSSLTVIATVGILSFSVVAAWFLSLGSRSAWLDDVESVFRNGDTSATDKDKRGDDLHVCRIAQGMSLCFSMCCFYTSVVTSMTLRLYIGLTSNAGIVDFICGIIGFPRNGKSFRILMLPYKAFILGCSGLFLSLTFFTSCRFHPIVAIFGLVLFSAIVITTNYVMYAAQKAVESVFPQHKRHQAISEVVMNSVRRLSMIKHELGGQISQKTRELRGELSDLR